MRSTWLRLIALTSLAGSSVPLVAACTVANPDYLANGNGARDGGPAQDLAAPGSPPDLTGVAPTDDAALPVPDLTSIEPGVPDLAAPAPPDLAPPPHDLAPPPHDLTAPPPDLTPKLLGPGSPCQHTCDCETGLACYNGKCTKLMDPVYCCAAMACPAGATCISPQGVQGKCPGGTDGGGPGFCHFIPCAGDTVCKTAGCGGCDKQTGHCQ